LFGGEYNMTPQENQTDTLPEIDTALAPEGRLSCLHHYRLADYRSKWGNQSNLK
jgi:hypothetical protein